MIRRAFLRALSVVPFLSATAPATAPPLSQQTNPTRVFDSCLMRLQIIKAGNPGLVEVTAAWKLDEKWDSMTTRIPVRIDASTNLEKALNDIDCEIRRAIVTRRARVS